MFDPQAIYQLLGPDDIVPRLPAAGNVAGTSLLSRFGGFNHQLFGP